MPILPFKERAVAYLDVLGFEALVRASEDRANDLNTLRILLSSIEGHVKYDNATLSPAILPTEHPRYLFVSDTIIVSTPMGASYNGLSALVLKTTQIALRVMQAGYLVRGVINVGSVWHTEDNIFGTAYMEAAAKEKSVISPRVLLAPRAAELWRNGQPLAPRDCLSDGDDLIVDVLNEHYISGREVHGGSDQYYRELRIRITDALQALPRNGSPWKKWLWMAAFFNTAIARHGMNVPAIPIERDRTVPQLCSFFRSLRSKFDN